MTICIAAMAGDGRVVVVSDRMVTLGLPSTEFEQNRPKAVQIAGNCVAASSGNALGFAPIHGEVKRRIGEAPPGMPVADVAEAVRQAYVGARNVQMEQRVLAKIGLTLEGFHDKNRSLLPDVVEDATQAMSAYDYSLNVIVAGVDESGGHIFMVGNPGQMDTYDPIGHCAIGSGRLHAVSTFIANDYDHELDANHVAAMAYEAKRRSEKSQGVGEETDMYVVDGGGVTKLPESTMGRLAEIYGQKTAQETESIRKIEGLVRELGIHGGPGGRARPAG